jgi:hypothetical protein
VIPKEIRAGTDVVSSQNESQDEITVNVDGR